MSRFTKQRAKARAAEALRIAELQAGSARFEEAIWRGGFDVLHAQHEELLAWLKAHAPMQLAQFQRRDIAA